MQTHIMHKSHQQHIENQRTSAVGKPRKRDSDNRENARNHSDIYQNLQPDVGAGTDENQSRKLVLHLADKNQNPRQKQKIKRKQKQNAEKSELLGINRKNEVCVMLGNEAEHILRAAFVAFAVQPAAADSDDRLLEQRKKKRKPAL